MAPRSHLWTVLLLATAAAAASVQDLTPDTFSNVVGKDKPVLVCSRSADFVA
jgi:hypothetical protein